MCTNNEKNDQFYRKVAFLMYSERVNFRPQSWKEASKLKPHRGLGTRLETIFSIGPVFIPKNNSFLGHRLLLQRKLKN